MTAIGSSRVLSAAGTEAKKMYYGIYQASVVSTQDPNRLNRVTLKVPQILGTATTNWASPVRLSGSIPAVGITIYVMFTGGDINHPVYFYD